MLFYRLNKGLINILVIILAFCFLCPIDPKSEKNDRKWEEVGILELNKWENPPAVKFH